MISPKLHWPKDRIEAFCRKWKIARMELFGSALRDDFRDDSDVDVMVTFENNAAWSLFHLLEMEEELAEIVGRSVDLMTRRGVEKSRNEFRRKAILESVETVYGS